MKFSLLISFAVVIPLVAFGMHPPKDESEAAAWYAKLNEGIEIQQKTAKERSIPELAGYLFKFGSQMPNHPDPRWHLLYWKAQAALLAIPGHAQYFADALEKERSKLKPGEYMENYTDQVSRYLTETLIHLPSPETIKVLGHYLNDDRDTPASPFGGGDFIPYPGTAMIAFEAFSKIGLRNLPEVDISVADPSFRDFKEYEAAAIQALRLLQRKKEDALATYRAWWLEVESGRQAFSFKGQAVEYRFNPDGTWVSNPIANPPDDAPKPPAPKPPITSSPEKSPAMATTPSHQPALWPWFGGVLLVVLGILIWQIKARCARKSI